MGSNSRTNYLFLSILVMWLACLAGILVLSQQGTPSSDLRSILIDFEDEGITHIRVCRDLSKKEACVLIGDFKRLPIEDNREE